MNPKVKRVVKKKIHTTKRNTEMGLTNRIHDAVSELKRYDSPETLREINKIITPISSPTYPILQRYNEKKKISVEKNVNELKSRSKSSSQRHSQLFSGHSFYQIMTPSGSYRASPQQRLKRVSSLLNSNELSANPKQNTKSATASKNLGLGKYNVPNQSTPKKVGKRRSHSSQGKGSTQAINKTRILSRTVDNKKNPINHEKVTTLRYATVIPVNEMMNKQVRSKRTGKKSRKTLMYGSSNARSSNKTRPLRKKRPVKAKTLSNRKHDALTYYISPPDLTRFPSSESAVNKPLKNKKKVMMRPSRQIGTKSANVTPNHRRKASRDNLWKSENIKAFRITEERKNNSKNAVLPAKTTSARSFKFEKNKPAALDEGCSPNVEENYRMCKECPLRQLISKIDPAVGRDKRSYPVVAFTCCRKGPNVKDASTST